jgi:hypothetical protein
MNTIRNPKRSSIGIRRSPIYALCPTLCAIAISINLGSCASKDAGASPTAALPKTQQLDTTLLTSVQIASSDEPSTSSAMVEPIWNTASTLTAYATSTGGATCDGSTIPVVIRSVYSQNNIFFLVQYADATNDVLESPLKFLGGDFSSGADWALDNTTHDDGFSMMFEIQPATSGTQTFISNGCAVACHTAQGESWNPGMFAENDGRFDLWYWRASNSNASELAEDLVSVGSPNFSMHLDDPNAPIVQSNINSSTPYLPLFTVGGDNSGIDKGRYISAKTMDAYGNIFNVVTGKPWAAGDEVPSTTIAQIDPQKENDSWDVKSQGFWSNGKWTVKFKRSLQTASSSGTAPNDIAFAPGIRYPFSFAVHNHNAPGDHYGVSSHAFTLLLKN